MLLQFETTIFCVNIFWNIIKKICDGKAEFLAPIILVFIVTW